MKYVSIGIVAAITIGIVGGCDSKEGKKPTSVSPSTTTTPVAKDSVKIDLPSVAAPEITSITPNGGHVRGGTKVTLKGKNFTGVKGVFIGGNPLHACAVVDDSTIVGVTSLSIAGRAPIAIVDGSGKRNATAVKFSYNMGSGGNAVFTDVTAERLPTDHNFSLDSVLGDVDLDGDIDILVANSASQPNRLYMNNGKGFFTDETEKRLVKENDTSVHVELGDVNGDGYPDFFVANKGRDRLFINKGEKAPGYFYEKILPNEGMDDFTEDAIMGDVDGDGDLDIITSNLGIGDAAGGEQNRLYINDGKGNFTDMTAQLMPQVKDPSYQVVLFDADGDGDLDLFIAEYGEKCRFYSNDGKGKFTDMSQNLPDVKAECNAATAGDVDNDGDIDIVVSVFKSLPNMLLLNDGKGKFTMAPEGSLPPDIDMQNYDLEFGDLDGDGDLDLGVASIQKRNRVYINDGKGKFMPNPSNFPDDTWHNSYDIDFADFDGDGALDVYVSGNATCQDLLYMNDFFYEPDKIRILHAFPNFGSIDGMTKIKIDGMAFTKNTKISIGGKALDQQRFVNDTTIEGLVAAGNLGPVDIEAVDGAAKTAYKGGFIYEKFATGKGFIDVTQAKLPFHEDHCEHIMFGDVNGDKHVDIFACDQNGPHRLYLYDPAKRKFIDATSNLPPTNVKENNTGQHSVFVDIDKDGDLDIVIANDGFEDKKDVPGNPNRIYINDGKGKFIDGNDHMPADRAHTNGVAVGDLNGDGLPDIVFANVGKNLVYFNGKDGKPGYFYDASDNLPKNDANNRCVAIGDLDGDGDLDLYFGGRMERNNLYINDGKGKFTSGDSLVPDEGTANETMMAKIVDIDKDGDNDIVCVNALAFRSRLYLNDGKGKFTEDDSIQQFDKGYRLYGATDALIFDFEGDGDLDMVFTFWTMQPWMRFVVNEGVKNGKLMFKLDQSIAPEHSDLLTGGDFADFDGDGDLDIVISGYGKKMLLENTTKHPE